MQLTKNYLQSAQHQIDIDWRAFVKAQTVCGQHDYYIWSKAKIKGKNKIEAAGGDTEIKRANKLLVLSGRTRVSE